MNLLPIWFVKTNIEEFTEYEFEECEFDYCVDSDGTILRIIDLEYQDILEKFSKNDIYLFDFFIVPDWDFRYFIDEGWEEYIFESLEGQLYEYFRGFVEKDKKFLKRAFVDFTPNKFSLEYYEKLKDVPSPTMYFKFEITWYEDDIDVHFIDIL